MRGDGRRQLCTGFSYRDNSKVCVILPQSLHQPGRSSQGRIDDGCVDIDFNLADARESLIAAERRHGLAARIRQYKA